MLYKGLTSKTNNPGMYCKVKAIRPIHRLFLGLFWLEHNCSLKGKMAMAMILWPKILYITLYANIYSQAWYTTQSYYVHIYHEDHTACHGLFLVDVPFVKRHINESIKLNLLIIYISLSCFLILLYLQFACANCWTRSIFTSTQVSKHCSHIKSCWGYT